MVKQLGIYWDIYPSWELTQPCWVDDFPNLPWTVGYVRSFKGITYWWKPGWPDLSWSLFSKKTLVLVQKSSRANFWNQKMYPSNDDLIPLSFQKFIVGECCLRDAGCFVSVTNDAADGQIKCVGKQLLLRLRNALREVGIWSFSLTKVDGHLKKVWFSKGRSSFIYNEMREFSDHVCWARWICRESYYFGRKTFSDSETFWLEWYIPHEEFE